MIKLMHGDLFGSSCDAYVNTVNVVGVMGKGIAKEFKIRFPEMFAEYKIACNAGIVRIGKMHIVQRLFHPLWIINFPTKVHWKADSNITWIASGLNDLVQVIQKEGIKSIAVPALGCSNGGLEWDDVLPLMSLKLAQLENVKIEIYAPR